MARATTLIALLAFVQARGLDIKELPPRLYETLLDIRVARFGPHDQLGQAMMNMKLSVRGSIRTANNIIQTVYMVMKLKKAQACDMQGFIRTWNNQSGKHFQFTPKRAQSLRLLFEFAPAIALALILEHVEARGVGRRTSKARKEDEEETRGGVMRTEGSFLFPLLHDTICLLLPASLVLLPLLLPPLSSSSSLSSSLLLLLIVLLPPPSSSRLA